jgi:CheY-like chemotaxis protein
MSNTVPKTILIVDDEEEALTSLSNILRRADYEVIATAKGSDAINLAKNLRPDLIILDIVMPDIDGGDVAAILSENRLTAGIPIIFLTGILTKEEELQGKITGKHCVIAKPVMPDKLLKIIVETLSRQS